MTNVGFLLILQKDRRTINPYFILVIIVKTTKSKCLGNKHVFLYSGTYLFTWHEAGGELYFFIFICLLL